MPQSEANAGISPGCDEMPFLFLRILKDLWVDRLHIDFWRF